MFLSTTKLEEITYNNKTIKYTQCYMFFDKP